VQKGKSAEPFVEVPLGYPTSVIYIDESGSKASASGFFVMAAAKIRAHGKFLREIRDVRDLTGFNGEFKFSQITQGALPAYYSVTDKIEKSDLHVAACVVDTSVFDPFDSPKPSWRVHADVLSQLLCGCINRRELVGVLIDGISTPRGTSLEDLVKATVNKRLGSMSIISAACLDSRSSDGLQVADLVAGAIAFERRATGKAHSPKGKVAGRLKAALGVSSFGDVRDGRVNIATFRDIRPATRSTAALQMVKSPKVG
jgi:hypothetical protein